MTGEPMWHRLGEVLLTVVAPIAATVAVIVLLLYGSLRFLSRSRQPGQGPLLVAFGFLGGIIGASIGASLTPVVGTVLPAIITFIAGILAYLFGKDSLEMWRPVIPYCVTALSVSALVSSFYGGTVRRDYQEYERNHERWRLHYEKVQLEVARAQYLRFLAQGRLDDQILDPLRQDSSQKQNRNEAPTR